jgi:hypothetical protein
VAKKIKTINVEKTKYFFRPFYSRVFNGDQHVFDPRLPGKIVIVGCGGNGGYLAPLISRFLGTSPSELLRSIQLHLVDGDIVSEKNILRQNFISNDVGSFKAEVMAERCSMAFGMNITAHTEFLTAPLLTRLCTAAQSEERQPEGIDRNRTLIIGCVDRHEVRRLISEYSVSRPNIFYIDVGNELKAGQVFLSGPVKMLNGSGEDYTIGGTGIRIDDFYPSIAAADSTKAEPSCAEQTAGGLQRMDVNVKAATLTFESFCSIMAPSEIAHYITCFGPGVVRSEKIDDLDIKEVSDGIVFRRPT